MLAPRYIPEVIFHAGLPPQPIRQIRVLVDDEKILGKLLTEVLPEADAKGILFRRKIKKVEERYCLYCARR
ncbi:MAG TPA: hypothetical protein VJH63_02590 [Candidatus Paceibacterota bacterium]